MQRDKSLGRRAGSVDRGFRSEGAFGLRCVGVRSKVLESGWFDVLVRGRSLVCLVVDVGSLGWRAVALLSDGFPWPLAFLYPFRRLASRCSRTVLKLFWSAVAKLVFYGCQA